MQKGREIVLKPTRKFLAIGQIGGRMMLREEAIIMFQTMKINLFSTPTSIFFILLVVIPSGGCINCYTCSSWNSSDKGCEDPYNPANSVYTRECMVGKYHHEGMFPAYFCLKIIGRKDSTGELLVIRACILENMDNQCGVFRFDENYYTGCILTCDFNGCNESADFSKADFKSLIAATVATLLFGVLVNRH